MNTLLNILLGFLIFIFVSVTIVLMSGWIIMQVMHDKTNQDDCGCKDCGCDEEIPMLDRPLTKEELKEMNMEKQNKQYNIMSGEDMMNMKTEVGITASPEQQGKSFRGKPFENVEPREENDPNPNQK